MSIKMTTNLEELAEKIGSYIGMAEGLEQRQYMDNIIRNAHSESVPHFVKAAALSAKAGNFTHMYEFGVAGVTRGDTRFINPLSPTARLWEDVIIGGGGKKLITFTYRPATHRVPKHTTESTGGVDQDELDKLKLNQGKRYVFQSKAAVFELGIQVNIHPKQRNGLLFVPLRGMTIGASSRDKERKFTWARKVSFSPGDASDSTGMFSNFFFNWWNSEGAFHMAANMDRQVNSNILETEASMRKVSAPLKNASATNIKGASERGRSKTRKQWTIYARRELGIEREIIF